MKHFLSTKKSWFIAMGLVLLPQLSSAAEIPCYIQFVKDTCWNGYTVTMQLSDQVTQQAIGAPIVLGPSAFSSLQRFSCKPGQQVSASAKFSPEIWKNTQDRVYHIKTFWNVPTSLPPKSDKWTVNLCFSKDFIAVPLPATVAGNCQCNFPQQK